MPSGSPSGVINDTLIGEMNCSDGHSVVFEFRDGGEPLTNDRFELELRDSSAAVVLSISGAHEVRGNVQALRDRRCEAAELAGL